MAPTPPPGIKAESFGRGVLLLRLSHTCHVDAIKTAFASSIELFADGPRAVVLDTRSVTDVDDAWARDLSDTLAAFPSGLGGRAAIVRPTHRDSAVRLTRALDGIAPVFATRAGALLRAVIVSGAPR